MSLFNNSKKLILKTSFERRICAQAQDLQIFKVLYVSNESERSFPQHCILSSTTLHSRSVPLSDPPRTDGNARFITLPLKPSTDTCCQTYFCVINLQQRFYCLNT